jgi:hypothetical protein
MVLSWFPVSAAAPWDGSWDVPAEQDATPAVAAPGVPDAAPVETGAAIQGAAGAAGPDATPVGLPASAAVGAPDAIQAATPAEAAVEAPDGTQAAPAVAEPDAFQDALRAAAAAGPEGPGVSAASASGASRDGSEAAPVERGESPAAAASRDDCRAAADSDDRPGWQSLHRGGRSHCRLHCPSLRRDEHSCSRVRCRWRRTAGECSAQPEESLLPQATADGFCCC